LLWHTRKILRCILAVVSISYAFAQTPIEPASDPALGKRLFESQCAVCHGETGEGSRGPNLHHPTLNKAPDDAALRKVIANGIPPEMPGAWQLTPHEVASVAAFVKSLGAMPAEPVAGDPSRGERVYLAKGCAGCHMVRGQGSGFGPELTDIGARRSAAHLRESIVAPDAAVPEDFMLVELALANGSTIRGIRLNEDPFSIQIKDPNSEFRSYRKSELRDLRKLRGKSPMPSYERTLTPEELTDLTAYLATLRGRS
jgi:cytochrome c oxidase cbb3-type subunit 3